eukprot:tig00020610_g12014.t1
MTNKYDYSHMVRECHASDLELDEVGAGKLRAKCSMKMDERTRAELGVRCIDRIEELYELREALGRGGSSTVYLAFDRATGERCAVKMVNAAVFEQRPEPIIKELRCMRRLRHPSIIQLREVADTVEGPAIVLELAEGGDLFERILACGGRMPEAECARTVRQIAGALCHMHAQGIAHCDLKPENFLFVSKERGSPIKLADFGLVHFTREEREEAAQKPRRREALAGTPEYVAPEVITERDYAPPADMWSLGVIVYILLCGYFPFYGETLFQVFARVQSGTYDFPEEEWASISPAAVEVVRALLTVDPAKRMTAEQLLAHPWIPSAEACAPPLPAGGAHGGRRGRLPARGAPRGADAHDVGERALLDGGLRGRRCGGKRCGAGALEPGALWALEEEDGQGEDGSGGPPRKRRSVSCNCLPTAERASLSSSSPPSSASSASPLCIAALQLCASRGPGAAPAAAAAAAAVEAGKPPRSASRGSMDLDAWDDSVYG